MKIREKYLKSSLDFVKQCKFLLEDENYGNDDLSDFSITKREAILMTMVNTWFGTIPEELFDDQSPIGYEVAKLQGRINKAFAPGYSKED